MTVHPCAVLLRAGFWAALFLGTAGTGFAEGSPPSGAAVAAPATAIRVLLAPVHSTILSSEIAGKIAELNIREGESFNEGQNLIVFDCKMHVARLNKAEAQLREAIATREVYSDLGKLGSMSTLDLENAEARLFAAQAEKEMMKALVDRCEVKAPFPGRVAELRVKRFQYVAEGDELLDILDDRSLEIEMIVPSVWVSWLVPGRGFAIRIDETRRTYQAKVSRIGARIDPVSQTVKIYGQLKNPSGDLRAGMSGIALIERN